MRLIDHKTGIDCNLKSDELNAIIVENARAYEGVVSRLFGRINGTDEELLLYDEKNELLKNAKSCDIIFSPFDLNLQNSKFQKKLISYLSAVIESDEIGQKIVDNYTERNYIAEKIQELSEYPISFDCEYSLANILKEMNVKLAELTGSFAEKMLDYMSACRDLLDIKTFFMIGCKAYISLDEYCHLRKWIEYQNLELIFVENTDNHLPEYINKYILDEDMCFIH